MGQVHLNASLTKLCSAQPTALAGGAKTVRFGEEPAKLSNQHEKSACGCRCCNPFALIWGLITGIVGAITWPARWGISKFRNRHQTTA